MLPNCIDATQRANARFGKACALEGLHSLGCIVRFLVETDNRLHCSSPSSIILIWKMIHPISILSAE